MPDGTLNVGTVVNLGPLKTGMAEAQAAVKQASDQMAEAQAQFGKAAAEGSEQAAAALKFYQTQLNSARSAVEALAGAQERETETLKNNVTARMASVGAARALSSEIRIVEGSSRAAIAAVAELASQSEALGAVAQAAFIPFAAVGALEILGQMAEKVAKVYDEYVNLRSVVEETNKELEKQYDIGLALSGEHLKETREQRVLQAELTGPKQGRQNRGREAGEIFDQAQATERLAAAQGAYANATQKLAEFQQRAKAIKYPEDAQYGGIPVPTEDAKFAQTQIQKQEEVQKNAAQEIANAQLQLQNTINAAKLQQIEGAEKVGVAEESAAKKAQRAWDDMVQKMIVSGRLAQESAEKVTEAITADWLRAYKQDEEAAKKAEERQREATRQYVEDQRQKIEAAKAVLDQQSRSASDQYRGVEQSTSGAVSDGTMDPKQRIALLQQAAAQEYKIQQDVLKEKEQLDAADVVAYQKDLDAMAQLQQQYGLKQAQLAQQATQQMLLPYKNFFQQLDQSFTQLVNSWLTGTGRMSANFIRFGDEMAIKWIDSLIKMELKSLQTSAMQVAANQTKNAAIVAQDAAASAQTQSISLLTALKQITHNASVAATGAAAAVAGIPIVGPILAPIAGAATFVAVEALAAFDKGSNYVPMDGMAMLHKGETIIPASQQGPAYKPGQGGGDTHFHYAPQVSAIDGPSVASTLQKHGQAFAREQYRQLRLMNLVQ